MNRIFNRRCGEICEPIVDFYRHVEKMLAQRILQQLFKTPHFIPLRKWQVSVTKITKSSSNTEDARGPPLITSVSSSSTTQTVSNQGE